MAPATPEEKRKLLNLVLSNCTFDGETLRATYKKPFCWLAEGLRCSDWLPIPDNCKNLAVRSTFTLSTGSVEHLPLHQKRKLERPPIVPVAFEFQRLLDGGEVRNRAELARRFGISRARVTQIMGILDLPAPIVDCLASLFHEEKCVFTERQLRRIRGLPTEEEQVKAFEELRREVGARACSEPAPPPGTSHGAQSTPHAVSDST